MRNKWWMRNKCGTKFYLEFYSFRGYIESYYAQMSLCTVFESRGRHFSANYIYRLETNFEFQNFDFILYLYLPVRYSYVDQSFQFYCFVFNSVHFKTILTVYCYHQFEKLLVEGWLTQVHLTEISAISRVIPVDDDLVLNTVLWNPKNLGKISNGVYSVFTELVENGFIWKRSPK